MAHRQALFIAVLFAGLLALASCKKDEDAPAGPVDPKGFTTVLATGSGFRNIYTQDGGVALDMEVPANTTELCIAWYDASEYMTDRPVSHVKVASASGEVVMARRQAGKNAYPKNTYVSELAEFMPHSDSLYWTNYMADGSGGYWNLCTEAQLTACTFYGTVRRAFTGEWVTTDGYYGMCTMMQYPVSTNLGFSFNATTKNALEPINTSGDYIVIGIGNDSAYAAFVDKANPYQSPSFKAAISPVSNADFAQWNKTVVRRSRDGQRTGFCFRVGTPGAWRYYTFSSNNAARQVTLVHNGTILAHPQQDWTVYDIDPEGNIYYAGSAAANASGYTIYKATPSGTTTIGKDNLLLQGAVELVRYINGKVYIGTSTYYTMDTGMQYPAQMNIAVQE